MSEIVKTITNLTIDLVSKFGIPGIFILMALESASIPFPSFITMPFAGFLVTQGYWSLATVIIIGVLGNTFGGALAYLFGYKKGETWVRAFIRKFGKYILLTEEKFDIGIGLFNKHDKKISFISRIVPIVRAFTSLPAGVAKVKFVPFLILSTLGNIIYVSLLGYIGYVLGDNWQIIGPIFKKLQYLIIGIILIAIFYFIFKKKKKN